MDQHGARINESFDVKIPQRIEQPFRAAHIDFIIEGRFVTAKVKVGGQVDDDSNFFAVFLAKLSKCCR